jgi:hypothetical protein
MKILLCWSIFIVFSFIANKQYGFVVPLVTYFFLVVYAYVKSDKINVFTGRKMKYAPFVGAILLWPEQFFRKPTVYSYGKSASYFYEDGDILVTGSSSVTHPISYEEMRYEILKTVPNHVNSDEVKISTFW